MGSHLFWSPPQICLLVSFSFCVRAGEDHLLLPSAKKGQEKSFSLSILSPFLPSISLQPPHSVMLHKPTRLTLSLSFITAVLVANMAGPQYVYPAFGTSLTTRFKWTALENSLVSTASFIGVSFSGPLNAWMVERLGIRG